MTKNPLSILLLLALAFLHAEAQPTASGRSRKPQNTPDQYAARIADQVPEFGGFWYDNGRLTIGLTRSTTSAKANSKLLVLALLKKREAETGPVVYKIVRNNFTSIHAARKQIRSLFRDRSITYLDTDERSNIVRVGIKNLDDETAVREKIRSMGIAEGLFRIEKKAPVRDLVDVNDLRQRVRPLVGGLQTAASAGGGKWSFCSLGVVGSLNGIRGFFTNSHCTRVTGQVDGGRFFQFHRTDNDKTPDDPADRVGVETADAPMLTSSDTDECPDGDRCQYADAAFVSLDANVMARRGFVQGMGGGGGYPAEYEITGVVPIGVCGQKVKKIGQTTGLSRGEVESTCSDYLYTSGVYKLCQDEISAGAGHGDSGSAALLEDVSPSSSKVKFYGLVNGGDEDYIIVSPYFLIVSQLGAIDVMPRNDPRRVRITTPQHGASFGMNPLSDKVRFEANVFDPEGKNCGTSTSTCKITWTSSKDGVIGTGLTTEFAFTSPGLRTITATAKDGSLSAVDQIAINVNSTPPAIEVLQPTGPIYRGIPYLLYARATDSDVALLAPIACNKFTWTSNNHADIGTGTRLPENFCEVVQTFNTVGSRTLIVEARDPQGDRNTKNVPINVLPRPLTGPPIVSLLVTPRIIGSNPNGIYQLRAAIVDPDGGQRVSYKWKVKYGTTEKIIKSRQAAGSVQISDDWRPSDHVPARCGGWTTTVTLEVVDDQGQNTDVSLPIYVNYPLC